MDFPKYLLPFYEEGKQAYKDSTRGEDCPYTCPSLVKVWMEGWQEMFADEMAIEDLETDFEFESCYDPFEYRDPNYYKI